MMKITVRPASATDIADFATWQYEAPYDAYDIAMDPDEASAYFLGPEIRCHALLSGESLVGFCTFGSDAQIPGGDYGDEALDIGLGVRPNLTGAGNGHWFVEAVIDFATATFAPPKLRVSIAEGNTRALRVWSDAGFNQVSKVDVPTALMNSHTFLILVRELDA